MKKPMWKRSVSFFKPPGLLNQILDLDLASRKKMQLWAAKRPGPRGRQECCMSVLGHISVITVDGRNPAPPGMVKTL